MIRGSASEALAELRRATEVVERQRSDHAAAVAHRDAVIARAAQAGLTRRRVAAVVGLSAARVQQICDAHRDSIAP